MKAKRILIVEDSKLEYEQLKYFLEDHGFIVDQYTDRFDHAICRLIKFSPDLILIDIQLNGAKNGLALALEINLNYQIPFIFTSIIDDDTIVDIAVEIADYIHKPFQERQVLTMIKRVFLLGSAWKAPIRDTLWLSKLGQNKKEQGVPKYPVKLSNIDWIETNNKRKKHTLAIKTNSSVDNSDYEIRKTISEFYAMLPNDFVRVSESHIVNVKKITKYVPTPRKKKGKIFIGKNEITVTNSYYKDLNHRFSTENIRYIK